MASWEDEFHEFQARVFEAIAALYTSIAPDVSLSKLLGITSQRYRLDDTVVSARANVGFGEPYVSLDDPIGTGEGWKRLRESQSISVDVTSVPEGEHARFGEVLLFAWYCSRQLANVDAKVRLPLALALTQPTFGDPSRQLARQTYSTVEWIKLTGTVDALSPGGQTLGAETAHCKRGFMSAVKLGTSSLDVRLKPRGFWWRTGIMEFASISIPALRTSLRCLRPDDVPFLGALDTVGAMIGLNYLYPGSCLPVKKLKECALMSASLAWYIAETA